MEMIDRIGAGLAALLHPLDQIVALVDLASAGGPDKATVVLGGGLFEPEGGRIGGGSQEQRYCQELTVMVVGSPKPAWFA